MADIAKLRASITLDAGKFKRGLDQSSRKAKSAGRDISAAFTRAAQRTTQAFARMSKGIGKSLGGLSGLLAGAGLAAGFQAVASSIDEVAKSANQLGTTVPTLQALRDAFGKSGVEADAGVQALRDFNIKVGEAARGTGPLVEVLASMGINAGEFAKLPLEQRLGVFADAMGKLGTRSEQAAVANQAFGGEGVKLLPFLDAGSAGITKMGAAFAKTGAAITGDGAAGVEAYNDAMQDLQTSVQALVQTLVVELGPTFKGIVEAITPMIKAVGNLRSALVDTLATTMNRLVTGAEYLFNKLVQGFLVATAKLLESSAKVTGALAGADAAASQLNLATKLERSAGGFGAAANRARDEFGRIGQIEASDRAAREAKAKAKAANPLAGTGATAPASVFTPATSAPAAAGGGGRGGGSLLRGLAGLAASVGQQVAAGLQQRQQVTGVVQGVQTALGTFRTGEQVSLLRDIKRAVERTAEASAGGRSGALT